MKFNQEYVEKMKDLTRTITGFVAGCTFVLVMLFSGLLVGQQANHENGRYAVSANYNEGFGRIMVTIIDTQTGEIVRQEKYSRKLYTSIKENEGMSAD